MSWVFILAITGRTYCFTVWVRIGNALKSRFIDLVTIGSVRGVLRVAYCFASSRFTDLMAIASVRGVLRVAYYFASFIFISHSNFQLICPKTHCTQTVKVDSEWQIFDKLFIAILFTLVRVPEYWEGVSQEIFVRISFCLRTIISNS